MIQTADQKKTANLEKEVAELRKLTRLLVVHVERLEKEQKRMKHLIGDTSRSLGTTQAHIAKAARSLK